MILNSSISSIFLHIFARVEFAHAKNFYLQTHVQVGCGFLAFDGHFLVLNTYGFSYALETDRLFHNLDREHRLIREN